MCSSAHGGLRLGILGLTGRHSTAAAARAALDAGGNVSYQEQLGENPAGPLGEVDALILVGGVDGADAAVGHQGEARGIDGFGRAHAVPLDAGYLDKAADRITGHAEIVLHAGLGRVLDLLVGPAHDGGEPGRGH